MIEHRSDCPVAAGGHACTCLELTQVQPKRVTWRIPKNVWMILFSWGLAVIVLAGLLSLRMEMNQRESARIDAEQDRAMCELMTSLTGGPTPPPGPAGERARVLAPKIERVRKSVCD